MHPEYTSSWNLNCSCNTVFTSRNGVSLDDLSLVKSLVNGTVIMSVVLNVICIVVVGDCATIGLLGCLVGHDYLSKLI